MEKKLYVVLLEWCENSDDGTEIVLVTESKELAEQKLKELKDEELKKNLTFVDNDGFVRSWTIMDDLSDKFYHHGYFPDFCSIKVLEFIDPQPICPEN